MIPEEPENRTHLVAPKQFITVPILETIPDMQKLGDSMVSHMVGVVLSIVPRKRSPKVQKAHDSLGDTWNYRLLSTGR